MLPTYGSFAVCVILNLSYLEVVLDEMLVFNLDRYMPTYSWARDHNTSFSYVDVTIRITLKIVPFCFPTIARKKAVLFYLDNGSLFFCIDYFY